MLVALTGLSAATHVSNKAVVADQPIVTAIIPGRGPAGRKVRVFGRNLLIPHPTQERTFERIYVLFDGELAKVLGIRAKGRHIEVDPQDQEHRPLHEPSADDRIWVEVPDGLESGPVTVRVRNFKGFPSRSEDVRFGVIAPRRGDETLNEKARI